METRVAEVNELLRAGAEHLQRQRDALARDRAKGDALVIETTEKIVAVVGEIQTQRESELAHVMQALNGRRREPLDIAAPRDNRDNRDNDVSRADAAAAATEHKPDASI